MQGQVQFSSSSRLRKLVSKKLVVVPNRRHSYQEFLARVNSMIRMEAPSKIHKCKKEVVFLTISKIILLVVGSSSLHMEDWLEEKVKCRKLARLDRINITSILIVKYSHLLLKIMGFRISRSRSLNKWVPNNNKSSTMTKEMITMMKIQNLTMTFMKSHQT